MRLLYVAYADIIGGGLVFAVFCPVGFWFAVVVEVVAEYLFEED